MKKFYPLLCAFLLFILPVVSFSQNVMINVLTQNNGVVKKNEKIFVEVTINNTSPTQTVPQYKIKAQISFPSELVEIADTGHFLPKNWVILSNKKGNIILSNSTDLLPELSSRNILIAVKGINVGGPSSIRANLQFSNGVALGNESGTPTANDLNGDNNASTSIKVEN